MPLVAGLGIRGGLSVDFLRFSSGKSRERKIYIFLGEEKSFIFLRCPSFFGFDSKQVRSLLEFPPSLPALS